MNIVNQYQDGEYTVTEYDTGLIERKLPTVALTAPLATLTLSADHSVAAVNQTVTITAALDVPLDETFAVPIEDAAGQVVKVKAVAFVAGQATAALAFDKSGYYRLTEAGINRKLPAEMRIALPEPFEITVVE